jgi:F-type H+-transporting ATPase subunit a
MDAKIKEMSQIMDKMTPEHLFNIGPIPIDSTIVNQWLAMLVLFALVYWLTRGLSPKPKTKRQTVLEIAVGFFYSLLEPNLGKAGRRFLPLVGSLFLFIIVMNLLWFIPNVIPPTTDLSTTFGLAITTILTIQIIGIVNNGVKGYLCNFAQPFTALVPLNIVEEAVKPVSLSLRLYGNMFGEKVAVTILFILVPLFIPIPVMLLGVLMGAVQAFVFTLLTVTYLTSSVKGH